MKLLTMKLSSLAKTLQKAVLGLMTVISLLTMAPIVLAADLQEVEFSQAELDQMLAPIALYPDALLSQVLIASTYPLEIIQADRWVRSNKDLKAEDALKFAENKDWDPSVKALVAFPDILKRMSDDVDWTQRLGDAFLSDEAEVMDAVQRLRKRAYASGNLEKAQHITVEQDNNNIIIEPAEERIVYVPVYDTRVVYGNWWWPSYPPVYWHYPSHYTYVSGFYWGSSIYLGPTYFYSSCHWRDRRVVVIDRHHHHSGSPRFYTGRSIVHHEGSRQWRHDPVHRHGVAYYNNRLRETYGSRRDSHTNDRDYREHHRDMSRLNREGSIHDSRNPRINRPGDNNANNNSNNPRNYDRSEQVRERLNRTTNNGNNNSNGEARPWQNDNNANREANRIRNVQRDSNSGIRAPSPQQERRLENNAPSTDVNPRNEVRNNSRNDEPTRNRIMQQQRQTHVNNTNANENTRINQERRVVTDNADRQPRFTSPTQRVIEQRANNPAPQPRVERQHIEAPRKVEFAPRNEARAEQRIERTNDNPRFNRERNNDDKNK